MCIHGFSYPWIGCIHGSLASMAVRLGARSIIITLSTIHAYPKTKDAALWPQGLSSSYIRICNQIHLQNYLSPTNSYLRNLNGDFNACARTCSMETQACPWVARRVHGSPSYVHGLLGVSMGRPAESMDRPAVSMDRPAVSMGCSACPWIARLCPWVAQPRPLTNRQYP